MAERTNISWCDATMNFWIGCTKVSPACDHCYAEVYGNRFGVKWGPKEERRVTKNWVAKMNAIMRQAAKDGIDRPFVFSNSLSDIFDNEVPLEVLAAALDVMRRFPKAVFLLLTKRPQNIVKRFTEIAKAALGPYADAEGIRSWWPKNAAIGCTVVSQAEADRDIPWLLRAKAALNPAFAFLSMEPLLGPVNLWTDNGSDGYDYLTGSWYERDDPAQYAGSSGGGGHASGRGASSVDWVIAGGESGAHARPTWPDAFRGLRDQCAKVGVPFHFKQWGEWVSVSEVEGPQTAFHEFEDGATVRRVGTKRSGRLLDGVLHDARPEVAA